jgi:hypothetical protein
MGEAHSLPIGIKGHYPKYWLDSTITMLSPLFWEWLLVVRTSEDLVLCIGQRPQAQISNHGRSCTHAHFIHKVELGFFHFLEKVTGWLVPSAGQKISVQPG